MDSAVVVVDLDKYERILSAKMVGGVVARLPLPLDETWKPTTFQGVRVIYVRQNDPIAKEIALRTLHKKK